MERRIRAHLNATHHFREACCRAYNEVLRQSACDGRRLLHAAVVRVHDVLRVSLPSYCRLAPLKPTRGGVYQALLIRGFSLTELIVLNEAEFEELALDVIVEEASWWYQRWDIVPKIFLLAVVFGVMAVGNPDQRGFLAVLFAVYCVGVVALCLVGLMRFRALFFRV